MSKIYCIVGKSCVGKSTFYDAVIAGNGMYKLIPVIPYTTRPKRISDVEGSQYYFVDVDTMNSMEKEGKIIEKRCYLTKSGPWYYFTAEFGYDGISDYILITTLEGLEGICDFYGKDNVVVIYLYTDDETRLMRSINREKNQQTPNFSEVCRRYLADEEDFREDKVSCFPNLYRIDTSKPVEECVEVFRKVYSLFI